MLVAVGLVSGLAAAPEAADAQRPLPPVVTHITAGLEDGAVTNVTTPAFAFRTNRPEGASFSCSVDGGAEVACASPHALGALSDGTHTFRVRARDAAQNADAIGATRTFTVDTRPPVTTLLTRVGETTDPTPTYAFAADEPGTFTCRVSEGQWLPCASPYEAPPVTLGTHSFEVRATDIAGNLDPAWPRDVYTTRLLPLPDAAGGLQAAGPPAAAAPAVRAVRARCVRRVRGRPCSPVVSFRVRRTTTVMLEVRRASRWSGALRTRARPPSARITLPQRIDGIALRRGRYRITVRTVDDVGQMVTAARPAVTIR